MVIFGGQVVEGSASTEADLGGEEVSLLAGRLQDDIAATNLQPVPLALLKARPHANWPFCLACLGGLQPTRLVPSLFAPGAMFLLDQTVG